eukprot:s32_g24.t1
MVRHGLKSGIQYRPFVRPCSEICVTGLFCNCRRFEVAAKVWRSILNFSVISSNVAQRRCCDVGAKRLDCPTFDTLRLERLFGLKFHVVCAFPRAKVAACTWRVKGTAIRIPEGSDGN